jgi:hypothetical protein
MGPEVFTAMKVLVVVFCVVSPCSVVVGYQLFGQPCCIHRQGDDKTEYLVYENFAGFSWLMIMM